MRSIRLMAGPMLALLAASPAAASSPPSASGAAEKMKTLGWLAGEWEGEAWIVGPSGQKATVRQHERVEWKAGGEVLLVQGRGVVKDAQGGERVVHDALAALAWDPDAGRYSMWTYRAGGGPGAPEVTVDGQTLVWGLAAGPGRIRFTIRRDDRGRWVEKGERSTDGTSWSEFFGMTLSRKAEGAKD